MSPIQTLTERQQEIKDRLEAGLTARAVAEELGITRNAVYQQMKRLRDLGALPPDFNPSGQPIRTQPGADTLSRLLNSSNHDRTVDPDRVALVTLAQEMMRTRDELAVILHRWQEIFG